MMEIAGPERLRFGAYEADLHTRELWKHGTRIKLVGQPFEILAVLARRPGQLVTRDELRAQLWPGDTFVDFNHGLNAAVNKLRDALCDSADNPKYIETLPRRGYRFIAEVENARVLEPARKQSPGSEAGRQSGALEREFVTPNFVITGGDSVVSILPDTVGSTGESRIHFAIVKRWLLYFACAALAVVLGHWIFTEVHYREGFLGKAAIEAAVPASMSPLTNLSDRTSDPAFSPDGTRVAFRRESFVPTTSGIWVKQIGGEELVQITNGSGDSNPVWSPNGEMIAFSRIANKKRTIFEVPSHGGQPLALLTNELVPGHAEIDWSPGGETIAFSAKGRQGLSAIFLLAVGENSVRQLSAPAGTEEDWGPTFSPDGGRVVFMRSNNIVVMPAEGGEVRTLTQEPVRVLGSPVWAADGKSIIFSASNGDIASLWRLPATGGLPAPIREAGEMVWNPAVSKRGFRLACELYSSARSIDQLDLDPPGQILRTLVTAVSGENAGAQVSPDGKKLVFQSDRTGGQDIWVSDQNGQNAIQLTALGTAGAPRWSPDGRQIVFDVGLGRDWREPRAIFVVDLDGGTPHPVVQDSFSNNVPSWSNDGEWIFFASNRTGEWQVWKVRKSGRDLAQVTKSGGFAATESRDGEYLYYAKHNNESPEIWRVPVGGGYETPIYPGIRPADWAAWTVLYNGIMFLDRGPDDRPQISFYDFSRQSVTSLANLNRVPFWLASTHDGKSAIFDQPGQEESHVMMLENFR